MVRLGQRACAKEKKKWAKLGFNAERKGKQAEPSEGKMAGKKIKEVGLKERRWAKGKGLSPKVNSGMKRISEFRK